MKEWILLLVPILVVTGVADAIPNPSSWYCALQGYEYETRTDEQGNQYGVCVFPDGSECDTWAYYCKCEPDGITCSPGFSSCHWPCKEMRCKDAGEVAFVSTCCEGLGEIYPPHIFDTNCNKLALVGWLFLCSDCGNGICEDWESKCNCPADCGQPRIIYVDDDANGANDGSSWADAFSYLQDALRTARYGDEIRVAQGIYTPDLLTPPPPLPPSPFAYDPNPANGATGVNTNADLSWTTGSGATSHDVYFGKSSMPLFVCNQTTTTFDPGTMTTGTKYYWHIDEVNDSVTTTGEIWSFTTFGPPPPPPPESSHPPPPPPPGPPPANPRSATFQLINGVTIKGGYAGFGEPEPDAREINVYETILSGDLNGNDRDVNDPQDLLDDPCRAENIYQVVTGSGTNETAVLDGFTITAGNVNWYGLPPVPNYPPMRIGHGAGMCNYSGSPTVANCTFIRNTANGRGGGMFNGDQSSPTLTNCIFSENSATVGGAMYTEESSPSLVNCTFNGNLATGYGGGMCNYESEPTLTNCTFTGNSAGNEGERKGGGMYNWSSSLHITNCTFIGNSARDKGGALYIAGISNQTLNITNCTFIRNSAFRWGGAVYTGYTAGISNQTLTNCIFIDNSAKYFGGAMVIEHCNPTLINCTFRNNKTESSGGGISCGNASSTLINCEFIGNVAQEYGGGMYNRASSSPTILNCTFSGNSADDIGGGIYNIENSKPTLTNCIIWGNEARDGPEIAIAEGSDSSMVTVSYSDTQGGEQDVYVGPGCTLIWGQGNIDADPCFTDPGYWGDRDDPNIVVEPNDPNALWVYGDYHLLAGSPCINSGDPNYIPEPKETDLDGKPRIFGCQIDMGAFEYMKLLPAEVRFVPHNINLANKGRWITCYIRLPESYNIADIDFCILLLDDEIEPEKFWFNEENKVVAARFNHEQLLGILDIGAVELTITAKLTDGTVFEGTDIIKVIHEGGGKLANYGKASNPNPSDGTKVVSITADLSWTAGSKAMSNDVYFGTSSTPPFVCNQIDTTFDPGTMDYETRYYWRIDQVSKWGVTSGQLWSFTTSPPPPVLNASGPNPADGAMNVSIIADLSWKAGYDATSHDVYFGTSNPPPFVYNQTSTTFDPGTMAYSKTYYWRIDEVDDSSTTTGEIWKFTTMIHPPPP